MNNQDCKCIFTLKECLSRDKYGFCTDEVGWKYCIGERKAKMSDLKIETGKFYRLRNGMKYRCYAVDGGGSHPIHGAVFFDGEWYTRVHHATGALFDNGDESESDIIAEWHDEPVVNWDIFPPHIVCLAAGESQNWNAYTTDKLSRKEFGWDIDNEAGNYHACFPVRPTNRPFFTGDWRDSKVVRPGHDNDGIKNNTEEYGWCIYCVHETKNEESKSCKNCMHINGGAGYDNWEEKK